MQKSCILKAIKCYTKKCRDRSKWKDSSCSQTRRLQSVKVTALPETICRFSFCPIIIQTAFLTDGKTHPQMLAELSACCPSSCLSCLCHRCLRDFLISCPSHENVTFSEQLPLTTLHLQPSLINSMCLHHSWCHMLCCTFYFIFWLPLLYTHFNRVNTYVWIWLYSWCLEKCQSRVGTHSTSVCIGCRHECKTY